MSLVDGTKKVLFLVDLLLPSDLSVGGFGNLIASCCFLWILGINWEDLWNQFGRISGGKKDGVLV